MSIITTSTKPEKDTKKKTTLDTPEQLIDIIAEGVKSRLYDYVM